LKISGTAKFTSNRGRIVYTRVHCVNGLRNNRLT